jgi:hypothetical protein
MLHFTPHIKPSKGYIRAYYGRGDRVVSSLSMWIKLHDMGKYRCACDQNRYMYVYAEYLVYSTYWSIYGNYCMFLGSAHLQSMQ